MHTPEEPTPPPTGGAGDGAPPPQPHPDPHPEKGRRLAWTAGRLAAGLVALVLVVLILVMDPFDLHLLGRLAGRSAPPADEAASATRRGDGRLWTCAMHPQVIEDAPGHCPICGMALVPMLGSATATAAATVTLDSRVMQSMNVQVAVVERRDVERQIRTVGYLDYDPGRMVTVTTKVPGFVERVYVNYLGEPVRRGEPLFEIYSPELVQTQQELLSARRYADQMAGAPEDARRRAEALVEAARQRLAYWDIGPRQVESLLAGGKVARTLTVVAPASGLVMMRQPGLEGMAIQPGAELFHIADLSTLWLSVEVFEDQLAWLRPGSTATIGLSYFPGESFTGRVRYVEPQVSEKTRTVGLRLEVPNPQGKLRAGMYATVVFSPVVSRQALTVPSLAVLRTGARDLVIVEQGAGSFAPRPIELGAEGEGWTEVLSGLAPGEKVVTSSQFLIDSESNLREAIAKLSAAGANGGSGHAQ